MIYTENESVINIISNHLFFAICVMAVVNGNRSAISQAPKT